MNLLRIAIACSIGATCLGFGVDADVGGLNVAVYLVMLAQIVQAIEHLRRAAVRVTSCN